MNRSSTRQSASAGFTLIEVLVAVAIVAVALAAGSRAAGALLNNTDRLGQISTAQWCADNELNDMKLAKRFPDVGDSTIDCWQFNTMYHIQMKVQGTPNPNFRRVDLAVQDENNRPLITLSTVMPRY